MPEAGKRAWSEWQREREATYLAALEPRPDDPLLRRLLPPVADALRLPEGLLRSVERPQTPGTRPRSKPKVLRDALARKTTEQVNALAAKLLHTLVIILPRRPSVATVWQQLGRVVLEALDHQRPWRDRLVYAIGARALAFLTRVHPDLVTHYSTWRESKPGKPRREVLRLKVTPKYARRVRDIAQSHLQRLTLWCVAPPLEWHSEHDGGFHLPALRERHPLLKGRHIASDAHVSADTLLAVNALQRTAWRINTDFLDVALRLPDEVVATVLRRTGDSADSIALEQFGRRLKVAAELREAPSLYSVVQLDYRGRFYPVVGTSLKLQGDDLALALIRFAPPSTPLNTELRARAGVALKLAATDHYGPLPLDARPQPAGAALNALVATRVAWVREKEARICATAANPAANVEFWVRAKKPWQFLAWCIEWCGRGRECPEESTLPVRADCTTSVYQHIACLLRSGSLAKWTNLTRESSRVDRSPADFYEEVAKLLRRWLRQENERPSRRWNSQQRAALRQLAAVAQDVFTRDLVKSPAMTWAYGAGPQTLSLKFQRGLKEALDGHEVATGAGELLVHALRTVLKRAVPEVLELRDWLTSVASGRARPIEWRVPVIGFPAWMRRSYTHERAPQITGEINGAPVRPTVRLGERFDPKKHARAFMPNYIHSLDAAVVTLMIGQLVVDGVMTPLGTTHDAFTTMAAYMDRVQNAVREAMQRVYTSGPTEVLEDLATQLRSAGIEVTAPPCVGSYDLDELSGSLMLHS